ncbi:hypothetical protein [Helicobacter sp. 11S02596-1]|uniref:hypothetical protein n=1 Tax=Helicobacter sp. 11S02596-1 TaxID=1476194 RepID=UPI000BA5EB1C|nr:hypothetical protein [Helicobacter sp. 11S02596-1]
MKKYFCLPFCFLVLAFSVMFGVDNTSLSKKDFLPYERTYGVVFPVASKSVRDVLEKTQGALTETLLQNGLLKEVLRYNIPHITVLHIHNPDPSTPEKILHALPVPPKPFSLYLSHYSFIKASPHTSLPWWFDIGVEKSLGFDQIADYNREVAIAIAPLRATPIPSFTGPVYAGLDKVAQSQIRDFGVSGINAITNNQKHERYRPHMTLVYSDHALDKTITTAMAGVAKRFNEVMKTPIKADFDTLSIVEIGFLGNVLREIYRIDLATHKVYDVQKGEFIEIKRD